MSLKASCDNFAKFLGCPVELNGEEDRYSSYMTATVTNPSGITIATLEFRKREGSWKLTDMFYPHDNVPTMSQVFDQLKVRD